MYLGSAKLKDILKAVIKPKPDFSRVKNGAYELALGKEVFTTDANDKKKLIFKSDSEIITINPGQFALLLTDERIEMPNDKIGFISIKAGIKLRGLVNVSGFHVDPGFSGNLVFSVYNAGSSPISIQRGEPCFLIWFAELLLSEEEKVASNPSYNGEHKDQASIPPKYIDALMYGEPASPSVLSKRINDNQIETVNKFGHIEKELTNRIGLLEKELANKIALVDKDNTAKEYLIKTAIGLGIVIVMKFVLDFVLFGVGYNTGKSNKAHQIEADSTINALLQEKKSLIVEIDSLKMIKDSL